MQIVHPNADPNLVSYHRPELIDILPGLDLALDCWNLLDTNGRGKAKIKYLHKEPAEPKLAYEERLHRSTYTPIYRDSIRAYAGLLNRFQLSDPPPSLEANLQNVDLQGSSVQSFWSRCDEYAIRDGGVFVMVDMMPETSANNFIDQQNDGRRPYLIMIERKDVINWSVEYINGREFVNHATVRQLRSVPNQSGYGTTIEPIYYVLKPGSVEAFRLEKKEGKWLQQRVGTPVATSLPFVPLVWYGSTVSRFAQGDLPMNGLAELSIQHYQMRSDLHELLHKCAMPVPVRKGAPVGPDGRAAALILGPNTAVDLPGEGGDFSFAEPTGKSLERHQAEITHIEMLMDRSSLNFLYGANIKTATEASLRASQVASQVASLVRNKVSSFNTIMKIWAAYAGEMNSIGAESGIVLNDSLINRPLDPSGMAQLVNLYNTQILSHETVLSELQRGGVLDPDLSLQEEMKRVSKEKTQKLNEQVDKMTTMATAQADIAASTGQASNSSNQNGQKSDPAMGKNPTGPTGKAEPVTQNPQAKQ